MGVGLTFPIRRLLFLTRLANPGAVNIISVAPALSGLACGRCLRPFRHDPTAMCCANDGSVLLPVLQNNGFVATTMAFTPVIAYECFVFVL